MSEPAPQVPEGWYADPWQQASLRWWDGASWTGHVNAGSAAADDEESPAAEPGAQVHVLRTKHAVARRDGQQLFTAGTGPFIQVTVTRADVFANWTRNSTIATAALAFVGLLLVWFGWGEFTSAGRVGDAKFGMGLMITGLLLPAIPYLLVLFDLEEAAARAWRSSRGFEEIDVEPAEFSDTFPLFRLGTKRRILDARRGEVAGIDAVLMYYSHDYDKDDVPTLRMATAAERVDATWLVVQLRLPAPVAQRYPGISVQPASCTWPVEDGATRVTFESSEFDRSTQVWAIAGQDPVAVRELLGPQLIAALIEREITWEQRGEVLMVCTRHSDDDAGRDAACADAAFVYEHYLTEHL